VPADVFRQRVVVVAGDLRIVEGVVAGAGGVDADIQNRSRLARGIRRVDEPP
jgi:hypothetical protein